MTNQEVLTIIEKLETFKFDNVYTTDQIEKDRETLTRLREQLRLCSVSKCKHENGCITDKEGFEVCPDCGEWGENC